LPEPARRKSRASLNRLFCLVFREIAAGAAGTSRQALPLSRQFLQPGEAPALAASRAIA